MSHEVKATRPLDPLKAVDAADVPSVTAVLAYCDEQGASGVGDLVAYEMVDGLVAVLSLKPIPAKKLRGALEKAAAKKRT